MIKWLNFTGIFWLLPGVQQVDCSTAVDWHIKVKDIEYNVGLRKYFCITVSMRKISSIHELTLQIQQILDSHELNWPFSSWESKICCICLISFWPSPPKNHWNNFTEFALSCKKSVHSIYSFLKYSQLLDPMTRLATTIFDDAHRKNFWSTFSLSEFASTCKNEAILLISSGDMVDKKILQSDWLRKFWPISQGQKFSQTGDLCRNTANNIYFHCRTNSVNITD